MRHSTIFKSRWMALIWSAGIIWMAVDVAGAPSSDDGNQAVADNGMEQAIAAFDKASGH